MKFKRSKLWKLKETSINDLVRHFFLGLIFSNKINALKSLPRFQSKHQTVEKVYYETYLLLRKAFNFVNT